jgi:excisionase family DNA binding protein
MTERSPVLTVKEVSHILKLNEKTVRAAIEAKQIPSLRFGRRVLVPRAKLERLLQEGGNNTGAAV